MGLLAPGWLIVAGRATPDRERVADSAGHLVEPAHRLHSPGLHVLLPLRHQQLAALTGLGGHVPAIALGAVAHHASDDPIHQPQDRKSTRLNSSHVATSYAVFCLRTKQQ